MAQWAVEVEAAGLGDVQHHPIYLLPQVEALQYASGVVHALLVLLHLDDDARAVLVVPDVELASAKIEVREVCRAVV